MCVHVCVCAFYHVLFGYLLLLSSHAVDAEKEFTSGILAVRSEKQQNQTTTTSSLRRELERGNGGGHLHKGLPAYMLPICRI